MARTARDGGEFNVDDMYKSEYSNTHTTNAYPMFNFGLHPVFGYSPRVSLTPEETRTAALKLLLFMFVFLTVCLTGNMLYVYRKKIKNFQPARLLARFRRFLKGIRAEAQADMAAEDRQPILDEEDSGERPSHTTITVERVIFVAVPGSNARRGDVASGEPTADGAAVPAPPS